MDEKKFADLIGQMVRKINILNKDQKVCFGLTIPQCYTVETLGSRGKLPMNELSQAMGVTISTMTRTVDILVRMDLVKRFADPDDRRKVYIELTVEGLNMEQKLRECSFFYSNEILKHIPPEKAGMVLDSLGLLLEGIDKVKENLCCIY